MKKYDIFIYGALILSIILMLCGTINSPVTEWDPTRFTVAQYNGTLNFMANEVSIFDSQGTTKEENLTVGYEGLRYAYDVERNASLSFNVPQEYNKESGFTFELLLVDPNPYEASLSGDVKMNITCYASTGEDINGTSTEVTMTVTMSQAFNKTIARTTTTPAFNGATYMNCIIGRDIDDGADTFGGDIELVAINVEYGRKL